MIKNSLILGLLALCLNSCETTQHFLGTPSTYPTTEQPSSVNVEGFPNDPAFWQANTTTIWNKLQHIPFTELQTAALSSSDPNITAWLKLAAISKQYSLDTHQLVAQLIAWRTAYPAHAANALFPDDHVLTELQNTPPPKHITLLLPLQGKLSDSGQAVRDGFLSAYYSSANKGQQSISFLDTNQNPSITALYQQAIAEGAETLVGPLTREEVQTLLHQGNFPVPTLALNYTDIWFGKLPDRFYEFGLSPLDEAKQLAEKAWQANHKRALIIAPEDDWGHRVTKTLIGNWKTLGGTIADTFYFNSQTDLNQGIANLLHASSETTQERRQDFDTIFLLAPPEAARQIVPLLKYYYAGNIPIFSTSAIYSGTPSPQKDSDLNGVTFSDTPWTLQMAANPQKGVSFNRLYALGRDAYFVSCQLNRLQTLSNFPMYGATGALTLTSQQQIYRRLAWVQMHNGRP